jgi:oxygen-independent coproporphyrinogen-3 oxidase
LRKAGFNRISIGVQSFSDPQLQQLGRAHTVQEAKDLVIAARHAGFDNLSLDLMYGLPGSKSADWQKILNQAVDLCPDHLSLYELTLEQGTPFHDRACSGTLVIPFEEDILEMMTITSEILMTNGFHRYEISNYAKPGRTCRHNINYWQNGSYLGLGAGAVSCFSGTRCRSIEDVNLFCRAISEKQIHWSETEALDKESSFRETVIMGLRMIQGVSLSDLKDRYHLDPITYYGLTLQNLIDKNLLEFGNNSLRLTDKGLSLANTVMAELV